MSFYLKVILVVIGVIFLTFDLWLLLRAYLRGQTSKRTGVNVFMAEKLFFIGEFIMRGIEVSRAVKNRRKRLLMEMYDQNMANEINANASYASPTYVALGVPLIAFIGAFTGNATVLLASLCLLVFMCLYFDIWLRNRIEARHMEIQYDYATVLTKMSLLVNAGLTASDAFEKVAYSNNGLLYREMQKAVSDISNGMSIDLALSNLAVRGGCKEIKKFVSLYKQNISKGGPEFPFLLSEMADAAWIDKKNRARLAGGVASQKLLLPIMLMFSGVILMVIVPAFNSLL